MKWPRILIAALALSATAGSSASAADLPDQAIATYDTDRNGVLSDAEKAAMKTAMEAERQALIAKYDKDRDGALNETERAAMRAELESLRLAQQAARFAALDADGNGGLSLAEFGLGAPANASAERIQAAFTRMDADGNGVVSLEEFTAKPSMGGKKHPSHPPAKTHDNGSGGGRQGASVAMAW